MRIAYVYDAVHPWVNGGVETRVWNLATRLADDHEVVWYGLQYWNGPATVEREGVTLRGVAPPRELYVGGRRSIAEAASFAARLLAPLAGERFDVVDCQVFPYLSVFPSALAAGRHRAALVLTWHEVWRDYWYEYLGRKGAVGKGIERAVARLPARHVAVSERTRRDLRPLGPVRVPVVPNGIDFERIERVPAAPERIDVLCAGRLIPEKNVDLLLRAVALLRDDDADLRCVVVGEGPERERLESLAADLELGGTVAFREFLPDQSDLFGLMKAADVYALPSRREGFGISAVEAQACGTPVVAIRHPQNAASDLIDDGVTGVVSRATPAAYAAALGRARGLGGDACVAAARHYDWDAVADRTERLYRRAIR